MVLFVNFLSIFIYISFMDMLKFSELKKKNKEELLEYLFQLKKDVFAINIASGASVSKRFIKRQIARVKFLLNDLI